MSSEKLTASTRGRDWADCEGEAISRATADTASSAEKPRTRRVFTTESSLPRAAHTLGSVDALFGRSELEAILPHREPFLLIDEVVELDRGKRVVARKRVREDEWYFRGHF